MKNGRTALCKALCLTLGIALFLTTMPTSYADGEECICDSLCTPDDRNHSCPACEEDIGLCQGLPPITPSGSSSDEGSESGSEESGNEEGEIGEAPPSDSGSSQIDDSYLEQLGDLQNQQSALQDEQDRLNQLIAGAQTQLEQQRLLSSNLDYQISLTKQAISLLEEKISLTENNIAEKERSIAEKEDEIDDGLSLFRERIRALYLSGGNSANGNYMTMLLSSQSISEFLTRTEVIRRVSEHDQELITEMRTELSGIKAEKELVEQQKAELEGEKDELSEKTESLETSLSTAAAAIQDLSAMEQEYLANREVIEAQMKQVQSEIADIYAVYNSQYTDYVGGELAWPVPGFGNITCYYGWRWGNSDFHTGMDISGGGVYGANIIAANTGTVMFVRSGGYSSGYAGGYGSYLIIDHGGGVSTLYAHCSEIYVSEGEVVAKGQPVAAVGSTGWSTGPHLHFEVRIDGEDVDPLPYVTG